MLAQHNAEIIRALNWRQRSDRERTALCITHAFVQFPVIFPDTREWAHAGLHA